MKHLKALCSIFLLGFIIFLCSCTSELPGVKGNFTITRFTTALEVNVTFVDTNEHDLYYDNVRSYVIVENTNADGEVKEVSRHLVSVNKPTVVLDPMGTETSETYPFEETEYTVYLDKENKKYFIATDADGNKNLYYLNTDSDGNLSHKEPQKITEIPTNLTAGKVSISGLSQGTEYTIKLIISANSKQATLKTETVETLNGGESSKNPIIINSVQELAGMNKDNDAYYKLGQDINVDGSLSTIFNSSTQFKGHFDGDGYTISGFTISGNNYSGLFGYMLGATVENLKLKDVKFNVSRGETYLGALAGYAKNCTISDVTVENVEFTYSGRTSSVAIIGGFVGEAENSTIKNCTVTNSKLVVSSAQLNVKLGGFVGLNDMSLIDDCHTSGSIEATITYTSNADGKLLVGGFAGVNDSNKGIVNSSTITDIVIKEPKSSTSSGVKSHKLSVGGFVGTNETFHNRVSNSVAIGDITVSATLTYNAYVGGFVGDVTVGGIANLSNCLYKAKENGIKVTFMKVAEKTEGEEDKVEDKQKAFVSLNIGYINGDTTNIVNVIAYSNSLTIENEHDNVVKAEPTISTVLSAFSEKIQKIVEEN